MTNKEFVQQVQNILAQKTIYAKGAIGTYVTESTINSLRKSYPVWYYASKIKSRYAPLYGKGYYAFDCSGMIKQAIWGFEPQQKDYRCTKGYEINGISDFQVDTVSSIKKVAVISEDWKNIEVGEILFTPGHVGVYIGEGLAIECTTAWTCNVQKTAVQNIGKKNGYNSRSWKYHGKLYCIDYEKEKEQPDTVTVKLNVLKKGVKSEQVKTLQFILSAKGFKDADGKQLVADGSFGQKTLYQVQQYQKKNGLTSDGSVGEQTWKSLLGA